MQNRIFGLALMAFTFIGLGTKPCLAQENVAKDEVQQIAEEAFIYGFPMVMGYGILYEYAVDTKSDQYKAPFNQIYNTARVYTPKDTAVVTPNSDTPYSFVWADLRTEPLVLSVPEVEQNRYYSVMLADLYSCNYGYIGSRATGNGPGTYMIAGPNWKGETPRGIKKLFRCETEFSLVLYRTQLFGPEEINNLITRPIESAVSGVNGIREVTSTSREGSSVVVVNFELSVILHATDDEYQTYLAHNKQQRRVCFCLTRKRIIRRRK